VNVALTSPTYGAVDHSIAAPIPITAPGAGARDNRVPGPQPSPVSAQYDRAEPAVNRPVGLSPWIPLRRTSVEAESLSALSPEQDLAARPELLAGILPVDFSVDFSGLESSVKNFFDQIDQLGLTLTESQVNVLFSSGIVAAAATVAVEITRRQLQPSVQPALARGHGRLPYSDYF